MLAAACGSATDPGGTERLPVAPKDSIPITGAAVPALRAMDDTVVSLMRQWKIPGGAVAVTYRERLVYARGFGWADTLAKEPVQPDALFRIASVSKPVTALAVLRLAEAGRLSLDAPAFALIPDIAAPAGATVDPRLAGITVRQLLWHVGGWDRAQSGDPVFQNAQIAAALGVLPPASSTDVIRYMMGRPLDFAPGDRYAYSNFGYMVLGRIIEHITGSSYESWVANDVLTNAGIHRMRIGHSRIAERAPGEVRYYDLATGPSVFPGDGTVPFPYGGFYLEHMDSHGGWIASAVDLAKLLTAADGGAVRPDVISAASFADMLAMPPRVWTGSSYYYGLGWLFRPSTVNPSTGNLWHNGSLPGTASFIADYSGIITVAAVFNARAMVAGSQFESLIDPILVRALATVTSWPDTDLFPQFN